MVVLPGALAVVFSALLGCSPERKADPEMERLDRMSQLSKEQMDAIAKMIEAINNTQTATNSETRAYWSSNMMHWSKVSHEAFLKLKNE